MPTSRLITEGEHDRQFGSAPRLRQTRDGLEGRMEFLVDTSNEYEALFFSGLPALGAAYSNAHVPPIPNLVCVSREYRYVSRKDDPDGTGAIGVVTCDYREISGGFLPPPTLNTRFTVLNLQTESLTVKFDRRFAGGGAWSLPLANGAGYPRKVGTVTAQVYVYIPLSSFPDFSRLLRLSNKKKLNGDPFQLPLIVGTSVALNIGVGQAQYEGFSHETKNGLIEFRHELSLAEDFLFHWVLEDSRGEAIEDGEVHSEIYESESFAGLW